MVNQDNVISMGKNIDFMQNLALDTIIFIEDGQGELATDHNIYENVALNQNDPSAMQSRGWEALNRADAIIKDKDIEADSEHIYVQEEQSKNLGHYNTEEVYDANGDGSNIDEMYDIDECARTTGATVVLYTQSAGYVDAGSVEGTLAVGLDNLSAENKLTMTTQHIDASKSSNQTAKRSIQIA